MTTQWEVTESLIQLIYLIIIIFKKRKSKKWKWNNLMEFEYYRDLWASHEYVYMWTSKKITSVQWKRCNNVNISLTGYGRYNKQKVKIINFGSKPLGRASRPVKMNHAVRTDLKVIASERVVRRDVEGPRVVGNPISDTCQLSMKQEE